MVLAEMNPKGYIERYIYGNNAGTSRAMAYGSRLADSLETGELSGDMAIDIMSTQLPRFELMDVPFTAILKGEEDIELLIKMDSRKEDLTAFKEYKTGVTKWNQKKADESGQITFYAMGAYLKTGKIPHDIELIHLPTHYVDGKPQLTGEMFRYPTQRHMGEILNMMVRAKRAWATIGRLMEQELL